jgi:hypothetical protein
VSEADAQVLRLDWAALVSLVGLKSSGVGPLQTLGADDKDVTLGSVSQKPQSRRLPILSLPAKILA